MATVQEPRVYRPHMGPGWFLRSRRYFLYMLRELTGLVMAIYLFILLWVLLQGRLGGRAAYEAALPILHSPGFVTFSLVVLFFSLFHTFSFFALSGWVGVPAPGGKGIVTGPKLVVAFLVLWFILTYLAWYLLFRGLVP